MIHRSRAENTGVMAGVALCIRRNMRHRLADCRTIGQACMAIGAVIDVQAMIDGFAINRPASSGRRVAISTVSTSRSIRWRNRNVVCRTRLGILRQEITVMATIATRSEHAVIHR